MDIKDLRKLSRKELLELLIEEIKENDQLRKDLKKKEEELDNVKVISNKAGSLAEASLSLVDIFKKADEAAQIYLNNLKNIEDLEE